MISIIAHIYGPLYLHSYGVCIVVGFLLAAQLLYIHIKKLALVDDDQFGHLLTISLVSALVGGRVVYYMQHYNTFNYWHEVLYIWHGGFAILGSILGVLCTLPWYLKYHQIPFRPIANSIALYAPIVQSFGRIGCFCAGCCYGTISSARWAVTYTDPTSCAPLFVPLLPTQLVSATLLMVIFIFLYMLNKQHTRYKDQLFIFYLIASSAERFFIDFFRGDRDFFYSKTLDIFSINQWICLAIVSCSISMLAFSYRKRHEFI